MPNSWITLLNGKRVATFQTVDDDGNPIHLQQVVIAGTDIEGISVDPALTLGEPLRLDGEDAGAADWSVDGSVTPQAFAWIVPDGYIASLRSLTVVIVGTLCDVGLFGGITELTDGLLLQVIDKDGEAVLMDLAPLGIKTNEDWNLIGGTSTIESGNASDRVLANVPLMPGGRPLLLTEGQSLRLTVQDDLSTADLTSCRCMVLGEQRPA